MMQEQEIQQVVSEVIARLAVRLGADGSRGTLIAAFTGATVGFKEGVQQVGSLILDGYRVQLAFSPAAEELYGRLVKERLAGFPHLSSIDPKAWLSSLIRARAVVVPLLSVNTLSKISMLIADTLVANLILHALFVGKTVVVARNGVDPLGQGRRELGFHKGSPALTRALLKRMQIVSDYGCRLTDVQELKDGVDFILAQEFPSKREEPRPNSPALLLNHSGKVVSAGDILRARDLGADLHVSPGGLITPLARELAHRYGVTLVESDWR
ncbi:MAG: hypothetical protein JSU72_03445 [Deltaproteobacteria bacterium]|nr:MAG: hypothetical protein JSU72_03445 [Deltaproteobacteria bacterium]